MPPVHFWPFASVSLNLQNIGNGHALSGQCPGLRSLFRWWLVLVVDIVGLDNSTSGLVNTWMGDRLRVNHLGITSHLGQLNLSSLRGR